MRMCRKNHIGLYLEVYEHAILQRHRCNNRRLGQKMETDLCLTLYTVVLLMTPSAVAGSYMLSRSPQERRT
jgi:hypothetical protein